jgi:hypothetical protein
MRNVKHCEMHFRGGKMKIKTKEANREKNKSD